MPCLRRNVFVLVLVIVRRLKSPLLYEHEHERDSRISLHALVLHEHEHDSRFFLLPGRDSGKQRP